MPVSNPSKLLVEELSHGLLLQHWVLSLQFSGFWDVSCRAEHCHLKAASAHPGSEKMLRNTGHEQSIPGKTSNKIYVNKAKHDCNSWLKMQISVGKE